MQQIEAVIHQSKLAEVRDALGEIGIEEFMEISIKCYSHQGRHIMSFRGARFVADIVEKVKIEVIATDEKVEKIAEAIGSIAKVGNSEICRIGIRPYREVV